MIHLLWCTIRPEAFITIHPYWIGRSNKKDDIKTYIAVNYEDHRVKIQEYLDKNNINGEILVVNTTKIGVCYPSYVLSQSINGNTGDIVVFASDDFLPPQNWDEYLRKKLENKEGGLLVRDGYQLPDSSNMQFPCITIPILTWGCFIKLNKTIYNPAFNHMYSDAELYLNLKDLGMLIDERMTDPTIFEHLHHASGKRKPDQIDAQYHQKWKDDENTWNVRRYMTVEKRIWG